MEPFAIPNYLIYFYCKYNLENWKHLHKQSRGTKKFIPNAFAIFDGRATTLQANYKLNSN